MLISSSRNKAKDEPLCITIGGEQLEQVAQFKYLGMELHVHLNFNAHVNRVIGRVNQRTGLLWRVRPFISMNLAKQLYTSLVEPHFLYLDYIYDGCGKVAKEKLQVCQNNALRAVLKTDCRHSTTSLHNDTNAEWLDVLRKKSTCLQVYKSVHEINPKNVNEMFQIHTPIRTLRDNTGKIQHPLTRTALCDGNIRIRGAIYWGQLDSEVRNAATVNTFKSRIKKFDGFNTHIVH